MVLSLTSIQTELDQYQQAWKSATSKNEDLRSQIHRFITRSWFYLKVFVKEFEESKRELISVYLSLSMKDSDEPNLSALEEIHNSLNKLGFEGNFAKMLEGMNETCVKMVQGLGDDIKAKEICLRKAYLLIDGIHELDQLLRKKC